MLLSLLSSSCFTVCNTQCFKIAGEVKVEYLLHIHSLAVAFFFLLRSLVCLPIMRSIPIRSIICRRLTFYSCKIFELFFLPERSMLVCWPESVKLCLSYISLEKKGKKGKASRPVWRTLVLLYVFMCVH